MVNSGLTDIIFMHTIFGKRDYFLLMFGCGGKIAINCFVLITGYFMCESQVTLRKWLRLLGEVVFYGAVIYGIFVLAGYETFSVSGAVTSVFPFTKVKRNFTTCYLLFYGLIPYMNRMLHAISDREHLLLMGLCLLIYTVLPSFLHVNVEFNYVTWFCVIYILAAYLRMHPRDWFDHTRLWAGLTILSIFLSLGSIVWQTRGEEQSNLGAAYYYIADSNKILAVVTAVCAFMLFRNLRVPYSRFINTVAASTFGVLMIHAKGDIMRQWLWHDVCRNVEMYDRWYLPVHAVGCVVGIYVSCTLIDLMRRRLTIYVRSLSDSSIEC